MPGSVYVFQEPAVAAGTGEAEADPSGEAVGAGGLPVPAGLAPSVEDGSGWDVHAGLLLPGALHPAAKVPATRRAAARNPHDVTLHVMTPA
ncbi:hypothetical protein [Arthrobacter sp. HMWF013]|uniref:hypothetical protein n=1 Tax=Arthrobacter sp. HMWF013 TaxID=2056849 RepID=UPI00280C1537|nr:hypothetical protein [Arthrobacter sp. HMWF013]